MADVPTSTVAPPATPTLDFLVPASTGSFRINGGTFKIADPAKDSVKFGLWDHAFDSSGRLINNEPETSNYVGSDSRRFYIRVVDPRAIDKGIVNIQWTSDLFATKDDRITLLAQRPGEFISRGLMLVRGEFDVIPTHSGISGLGITRKDQPNFRIRRSGMFGSVKAVYQPVGSTTPLERTLPVFQPSEHFRLPVHMLIFRRRPGGNLVGGLDDTDQINAQLWSGFLQIAAEIYESLGIFLQTPRYSRAANFNPRQIRGRSRDTGTEYEATVVDPPPGVDIGLVTDRTMPTIARAFPHDASKLRVFIVGNIAEVDNAGRLVARNRGLSITNNPTADTFGSHFISADTGFITTLAHEVGHVLANKFNKLGRTPVRPIGSGDDLDDHFNSPGPPLNSAQNLMSPGNLITLNSSQFNGPKRLWDANDQDGFNQVNEIFQNRFGLLQR